DVVADADVGAAARNAGTVDDLGALDLEVEHDQRPGDRVNATWRSHQAATLSNRADAPAAWTSWMASGSPDGASPLGSEIAGTPAKLHGAHSEASPVDASPSGAGAGAVGERSASWAASNSRTSSRKASRARLAPRKVTAEIVSPVSTSRRISGPYWSACLANRGSWEAAASDSRTVWPTAWIPSNDPGSFTSVILAPARAKASAVAWTWAATSREARRRSSGASAKRGGPPGSAATLLCVSTAN